MKRIAHKASILIAAVGLVAFAGQNSQAQVLASLPTAASPAEIVGGTRPVQAWTGLCERHPQECNVDVAEPRTVVLTRQAWQTILSVNAKVNAEIRPLTDQDHWGVADVWSLPTDGYGDCEDYQLLKRKRLVEAGLPRRAMRMTVVLDELGEGHAVLMIRTDRGDFVLDNKVGAVLPWHQTGYIYVKREAQDSVGWVSLGGATSPITTANR
jgi:predicted transglutaminase-like cysteine proteinase